MYCKTCKKEVENTLELYDGTFACAQCKKKFDIGELKITAESEERFTLSEIMFHSALKMQSNKSKYRASIVKAVAMCKQAAFAGHPKAVIRLAYYYEMGYGNVDEVSAFKIACQYYQRVWENSFTENSLVSCAELRQVAARRHLSLLEHTPSTLSHTDRYSYENVAARMKSFNAIDSIPRKKARATATDVDEGARITGILDSCFGTSRTPLFGLIAVQGKVLVDWANSDVTIGQKKEKRLDCYKDIKNFELYLLWTKGQKARHIVGLESLSGGVGGKIEPSDMYYLCFINERVKKFGRAVKFLEPKDDDNDALFRIVNKASHVTANRVKFADYVFYPDDVLMYRETAVESIKHAVNDLIDAVCKNMD